MAFDIPNLYIFPSSLNVIKQKEKKKKLFFFFLFSFGDLGKIKKMKKKKLAKLLSCKMIKMTVYVNHLLTPHWLVNYINGKYALELIKDIIYMVHKCLVNRSETSFLANVINASAVSTKRFILELFLFLSPLG